MITVLLENVQGFHLIKVNQNFSVEKIEKKKLRTMNETLQYIHLVKKDELHNKLKIFLEKTENINKYLVVQSKKLKNKIEKTINRKNLKIIVKHKIIRKIKEEMEKREKKDRRMMENEKIRHISFSYYNIKLHLGKRKIDLGIIYCLKLSDQVEKTISSQTSKLKEWYSLHFPELSEIVQDNFTYTKLVYKIGKKEDIKIKDLTELVEKDTECKIKSAARLSIGKEFSRGEMECLNFLACQLISYHNLFSRLSLFLDNKMFILAPNISALIGEKIGARLISHSGSMINLCKCPASTIQMFGAENALFKALKQKKATPKFGHIFNSKIISGSKRDGVGKLCRLISGKTALCSRIDALGENKYGGSLGIKYLVEIENKAKQMGHNKAKF